MTKLVDLLPSTEMWACGVFGCKAQHCERCGKSPVALLYDSWVCKSCGAELREFVRELVAEHEEVVDANEGTAE